MPYELLVLTIDNGLFQPGDPQWETLLRSAQNAASGRPAHENALIAACSARQLQFSDQALKWMDAAECNGARLALASSLSSRAVRTLMEATDGSAWVDRFAVVATADALRPGEGDVELYRLILRTVEVPAHCAALITASERRHRIATSIGMHATLVLPRDMAPPMASGIRQVLARNAGEAPPLPKFGVFPDAALAFRTGPESHFSRPPGTSLLLTEPGYLSS